MKIVVGFLIIIYYALIIAVFTTMPLVFSDYTNTINLNDTIPNSTSELDRGGFFSTGVSFIRFFGIVFFGIGLPSSVPTMFQFFFGLWQTSVTILTVMWVWSSIWDG